MLIRKGLTKVSFKRSDQKNSVSKEALYDTRKVGS